MIHHLFMITLIISISSCQTTVENNTQQVEEQTSQTTQKIPTEQTVQSTDANNESELAYLLKLKGQYPYQSKLFVNDPLKSRLQKILFGEYESFVQRMEVQMPIEVKGNEVFMEGLMSNGGGSDEAAIIVDVSKNLIWVMIYSNGNDLKVFKDDRDVRMPNRFFQKIVSYK